MTDEGCARGQADPDAPRAPVPAGDDAVDRQVMDPVAGLLEPLPASAGVPQPNPKAIGPVADDVHATNSDGRVGGQDGGVTSRVARRCLAAAAVLIGVAALCLLTVALRQWD